MNALFINTDCTINLLDQKSFMQQNFISVILRVSFMVLHTMNSYNTRTLLVRILTVTSAVIAICQAEKLSEDTNVLEKLFGSEYYWYLRFGGLIWCTLVSVYFSWRFCCYPYFRREYVSSMPFM